MARNNGTREPKTITDTAIAAIASAYAPFTPGTRMAIEAAIITEILRNVSAQTCYMYRIKSFECKIS